MAWEMLNILQPMGDSFGLGHRFMECIIDYGDAIPVEGVATSCFFMYRSDLKDIKF